MSIRWTLTCALVLALAGCSEPAEEQTEAEPTVTLPTERVETPTPAAQPHGAQPHGAQAQADRQLAPGEQLMPSPIRGRVAETMDSAGYTYMRIENGAINVWVAVLQMEVEVGDQVTVEGGSLMQGFRSRSLDRTFDAIVFASRAQVDGAEGGGAAPAHGAPPGHGAMPPGHPPVADG